MICHGPIAEQFPFRPALTLISTGEEGSRCPLEHHPPRRGAPMVPSAQEPNDPELCFRQQEADERLVRGPGCRS